MFDDFDGYDDAVDEMREEMAQDAREAVESDEDEDCDWEDDGQPSEYEEWQDVYGGDVEEYGTFGCYDD